MRFRYLQLSMGVITAGILLSSFIAPFRIPSHHFPYKKAGLTERQAVAHLLSRLTYGAAPGQIDEVVRIGLENWFTRQLEAKESDELLDAKLQNYEILKLNNEQIVSTYLKGAQVLRMAVKDGYIANDSIGKLDRKEYREQLATYLEQKGLKPERELIRQFVNQKILRATYSNNQLQEVMTEFWFNHFNVSFTKNICGQFIPVYEREVIRPNALGTFETLLIATAKSPAMLLYLDNFSSTGESDKARAQNKMKRKMKGLNENYAREVMELHTLGVDGGYTQQDVTEAARVLTGWTLYPIGTEGFGNGYKGLLEKVGEEKLIERGFVHDGDFLFTSNRHDSGMKTVLGKQFDGKGYVEGIELLQLLARHPATAKFICRKIATRFVHDDPPADLVEDMSKTFQNKNGNIRDVLTTMVNSTAFWNSSALRQKTKSPFELAISSLRALKADVNQPYQIYNWITKMGEQMYFYQAPTGFPDKDTYWINTGSLLSRMNFGLALADGRIPGVKFDLLALNKNHEPESPENALMIFSQLLMPERNTEETIRRLTPLLNDPSLQQKVREAASLHPSGMSKAMATDSLADVREERKNSQMMAALDMKSTYKLSQVVGILIGSPEFQRR